MTDPEIIEGQFLVKPGTDFMSPDDFWNSLAPEPPYDPDKGPIRWLWGEQFLSNNIAMPANPFLYIFYLVLLIKWIVRMARRTWRLISRWVVGPVARSLGPRFWPRAWQAHVARQRYSGPSKRARPATAVLSIWQ